MHKLNYGGNFHEIAFIFTVCFPLFQLHVFLSFLCHLQDHKSTLSTLSFMNSPYWIAMAQIYWEIELWWIFCPSSKLRKKKNQDLKLSRFYFFKFDSHVTKLTYFSEAIFTLDIPWSVYLWVSFSASTCTTSPNPLHKSSSEHYVYSYLIDQFSPNHIFKFMSTTSTDLKVIFLAVMASYHSQFLCINSDSWESSPVWLVTRNIEAQ